MRLQQYPRVLVPLVVVLSLLIVSAVFLGVPSAHAESLSAPPPGSIGSPIVTYAPSQSGTAAPAASIWPCTVQVFAGQASSTSMWATSYTSCNGAFASTVVDITAYHCTFSIGSTCYYWAYVGEMQYGHCSVGFGYQLWCPQSGYAYQSVGTGQLWKAHAHSCTTAYDGSYACGDAEQTVQF